MERTESTVRAREPWAGRRPSDDSSAGTDAGAPPHEPPPRPPPGRPDFSALFVLLDALRRAVPGDLQNQFTKFVREALLTLRGLIDWYLDRLERPDPEPRVEDIPID